MTKKRDSVKSLIYKKTKNSLDEGLAFELSYI